MTARGLATRFSQNRMAVAIGVGGSKILRFVTIRKNPASTTSESANGAGEAVSARSQAAYRSCSGPSSRCA